MGLTQTKLHWCVLAQDWRSCLKRLEATDGEAGGGGGRSRRRGRGGGGGGGGATATEASTRNPCGDLALHLACYGGQAPPDVVRALIDAHPASARAENRAGRGPLELATLNYRPGHPHRAEVLALLRWYRPGEDDEEENDEDEGRRRPLPPPRRVFSSVPPDRMYPTSAVCVICLDRPASVALLPCGHVCLCGECTSIAMRGGTCPVDRREVTGFYLLEELDGGMAATAAAEEAAASPRLPLGCLPIPVP